MSDPGNERWGMPAAPDIPKQGFFRLEHGRDGPVSAQAPICYGFSVVAKVKPGKEQTVRDYGRSIEETLEAKASILETLRLHYLRWILFDVGSGLHFLYQGIFDTGCNDYPESPVALFVQNSAVFANLEGWPDDWRANPAAVIKFFRDHQCPSLLEYGEYPLVTADEVRTALTHPPPRCGGLAAQQPPVARSCDQPQDFLKNSGAG
jgi:hypothetical protein